MFRIVELRKSLRKCTTEVSNVCDIGNAIALLSRPYDHVLSGDLLCDTGEAVSTSTRWVTGSYSLSAEFDHL